MGANGERPEDRDATAQDAAMRAHYEALPYPARDPADEAKRLVLGSPSHPVEIDHFLFEGRRDWSAPIRILVAGGGTGDALIMIAQLLAEAGAPAEIHYLDVSSASRRIAEARAVARGLTSIVFHTGDLLAAADLGAFDYIDCCGVLHHLADPEAGFRALSAALAPDGGMGVMLYAPYGRSGVYEMQAALAALTDGLGVAEKLAVANAVLDKLPPTNALARNQIVSDHRSGDAGVYDLLLHARDAPFDVDRVYAALGQAGLRLAGWVEPARYEPALYLADRTARDRAAALDAQTRAALAERLAGNIAAHRFYAAPAARGETVAALSADATPVIHNAPAARLAEAVAKSGALSFAVEGLRVARRVDKKDARLLSAVDGRSTLGEISEKLRMGWEKTARAAKRMDSVLSGFNHWRYSRFTAFRRDGAQG